MLSARPAWLLLPLLLLTALLVEPGETAPEADADEALPRVILRVGRQREVAGHVRFEDDDLIVIRTTAGKIESFPRSRVLEVVRLVDPVPGQRGVVVLRNGQRRRGVIVEDGFDEVVVEIDGIRTRLPRSTVRRVLLEPSFEERYARFRDAVRTPQQHLELCRWLVDERRYELARQELEALLAGTPLPEARELLTLVEAQLALADAPQGGDDEPVEAPEPEPEPPGGLISHEAVNLIRVYEIDFDRPPKVSVPPETIHTLIERYATSPLLPASESQRRRLFRADSLEVVELMFKLRARELYPQVEVITEPWALNLFRRRVHNAWLLNNCATARCHGGTQAGRFFLHRRRYRDERVRYTNLLILQRLELDPQWPLVNYDEPAMSLIVQYGLPRTEARRPHPDVRGWEPVFGLGGRRMLRDTIAWIDGMMDPRPRYPVEYEPPRLDPPAPQDGGAGPARAPR